MQILVQEIKAVSLLCVVITDVEPGRLVSYDGEDYLILWMKVWLMNNETIMRKIPFSAIRQKVVAIVESKVITKEDCEDLYQTISKVIDQVEPTAWDYAQSLLDQYPY